jgi:hypothetical protein
MVDENGSQRGRGGRRSAAKEGLYDLEMDVTSPGELRCTRPKINLAAAPVQCISQRPYFTFYRQCFTEDLQGVILSQVSQPLSYELWETKI